MVVIILEKKPIKRKLNGLKKKNKKKNKLEKMNEKNEKLEQETLLEQMRRHKIDINYRRNINLKLIDKIII